MNTLITVIMTLGVVAGASAAVLLYAELRRDLMMLQQNSYRSERYQKWLSTSGDTTSWSRLTAMIIVLFTLTSFPLAEFAGLLAIVIFSIITAVHLLKMKYKKPLVVTARVKRLGGSCALVAAILLAVVFFAAPNPFQTVKWIAIVLMALYIGSHILTLVALAITAPIEKRINRGYWRDAERILRSMPGLKIIGITGSYGKTSTKHYLYRILQEKYDVCMTPGSFNTPMGVIRTVREYLKPYNEVFICEMGAKQPGDIKEICDLVHPHIGIVTAVGEQHLESFRSIENVQRTKFELVDALPADGLAVVNDDFPYVASRKVEGVECIRYAISATKAAAYVAEDIRYSPSGTEMTVRTPEGERLKFATRLVGECNVSNLLAAIIVALRLKVPEDKIRYAVASIDQVEHRLNMKRTPGGVTIIDDAFNSNPAGSAMALDVLAMMTGGQRIIVTPGMIELGDRQAELNQKLGEKIARCADVAVVVGAYNREAIVTGIQSVKDSDIKLHKVNSFVESQQLLAKILKPGDTVLYENDLPDTFK